MCPGGFSFGGAFGGGGGVVGGAVGGPIGAVVGAWAGRRLGGMIRGRRSPEQFVDDMIGEGRIPEFLSAIVTRDRLIATERQSRGAGWVLDHLRDRTNDAMSRYEAGRGQFAIDELNGEIGFLTSDLAAHPDIGLALQLKIEIDQALISAIGQAQASGPPPGAPLPGTPGGPPAGGGGGLFGGGTGGGGAGVPGTPGGPPDFSKAAVPIIAAVVVLGLLLGKK